MDTCITPLHSCFITKTSPSSMYLLLGSVFGCCCCYDDDDDDDGPVFGPVFACELPAAQFI